MDDNILEKRIKKGWKSNIEDDSCEEEEEEVKEEAR